MVEAMDSAGSSDPGARSGSTFFGDRAVPLGEKRGLVRDVFRGVASRYDLMNDLMSLGVHRLWKGVLIDWLAPRAGMVLVDVGGGTGDIALRFKARGGGPVTVVDANVDMLNVGRDRALDKGMLDDDPGGIDWVLGDAEALPLDDGTADALTISFCIRNVTHIDRALAEARRVLKPGGRFLCLEFSHVVVPLLDRLYDTYSFQVLPELGHRVAGDREAYRYLVESIRRFPDQQRFAAMIADAGLGRVDCRNLSGGIAAIHSAWRV